MPDVRTTITFQADVYQSATARYRKLGFSRIGELVNAAVREYLHRRQVQEKHTAMTRAAKDPSYLQLLKKVSDDWSEVDAEGLPDY